MAWEDDFRKRMDVFSASSSSSYNGIPVSIKIRTTKGCYHREHSPSAYKIIDSYLLTHPCDDYSFKEHESGPEILVYFALATSGITLAKSIIDLITVIIKARKEERKLDDYRKSPLELVIRGFDENGMIREEISLKIDSEQDVSESLIEKAILSSANKMFSKRKQ